MGNLWRGLCGDGSYGVIDDKNKYVTEYKKRHAAMEANAINDAEAAREELVPLEADIKTLVEKSKTDGTTPEIIHSISGLLQQRRILNARISGAVTRRIEADKWRGRLVDSDIWLKHTSDAKAMKASLQKLGLQKKIAKVANGDTVEDDTDDLDIPIAEVQEMYTSSANTREDLANEVIRLLEIKPDDVDVDILIGVPKRTPPVVSGIAAGVPRSKDPSPPLTTKSAVMRTATAATPSSGTPLVT